MKLDISIIIPYFDTPYAYLVKTLKSCINQDVPIIIVDDKSTKQGTKTLHQAIEELSCSHIQIHRPDIKLTTAGAVHLATTLAKTQYVIRVDSDDILYRLPTSSCKDVDVIFRKASNTSLCSTLTSPKLITGIVFRTDLLQRIYSEYEAFLPHMDLFHEDTYHLFKMHISEKFKSCLDEGFETEGKVYDRIFREDSLSTHINKNIQTQDMRIPMLKLLAQQINLNTFELQKYIDIIKDKDSQCS
jgi:glycosyltransferase involved in cell wall biosynthesis